MSLYSRHVVPRMIRRSCGVKPVMKQREKIVPQAHGRVLEIGAGGGFNIAYYDRQKVSEVIGLDTSSSLMKSSSDAAAAAGLSFKPLILDAARIPLDDRDVDTVLVTYTLCSIDRLDDALGEMRRVLKPAGQLLFCEHGAAPDPAVLRWQKRLTPVWRRLAGGCRLDRDLPGAITDAGFAIDTLDHMYLPRTWRIVGYNSWGRAHPA